LVFADQRKRKRIGIEGEFVILLARVETGDRRERSRIVAAIAEHVCVLLARTRDVTAIFVQPRQAKLRAVENRNVGCDVAARGRVDLERLGACDLSPQIGERVGSQRFDDVDQQ